MFYYVYFLKKETCHCKLFLISGGLVVVKLDITAWGLRVTNPARELTVTNHMLWWLSLPGYIGQQVNLQKKKSGACVIDLPGEEQLLFELIF